MADGIERFTQFYELHVDAVFAYAASRTSRDRAEEVVEEVFVVAWRRFAEIPTSERSWLLGVARRVLANRRRADGRRTTLEARAVDLGTRRCADDPADAVVERNGALVALARLSDSDRETLCLTAWGGLSPEQNAQLLGLSRTAFLVRLHRARRRFRAALHDVDADCTPRAGRRAGSAPLPRLPVSDHDLFPRAKEAR